MTTARSGVSRPLLITALLFATSPLAAAQQAAPENGDRRTVTAFRLADGESVEFDGRLDEAVWARAVPAADFIQIDPANGQPATEPTEVRIAFDSNTFYMGVTAYDSEPDKLLGFQRRRDEGLGSDDRFMWSIDTFLDGRTGYYFEMNPSGLIGDGLIGITGQNRSGTASGTGEPGGARSAGPWRSRFRSGRSISTRTTIPGASTSSGRSDARTRSRSGTGSRATRGPAA